MKKRSSLEVNLGMSVFSKTFTVGFFKSRCRYTGWKDFDDQDVLYIRRGRQNPETSVDALLLEKL